MLNVLDVLQTVAILSLVAWVALLHRRQARFAAAGYGYDEHTREIARQEAVIEAKAACGELASHESRHYHEVDGRVSRLANDIGFLRTTLDALCGGVRTLKAGIKEAPVLTEDEVESLPLVGRVGVYPPRKGRFGPEKAF